MSGLEFKCIFAMIIGLIAKSVKLYIVTALDIYFEHALLHCVLVPLTYISSNAGVILASVEFLSCPLNAFDKYPFIYDLQPKNIY